MPVADGKNFNLGNVFDNYLSAIDNHRRIKKLADIAFRVF
jgi:hypothetical protein